MKTYMPLDGFRWSCDSDSALCDIPQTNVLGQAGAGISLCLGGLHFQNKQYNKSQTIKLQDNEQNYRYRDSSFEGRVT